MAAFVAFLAGRRVDEPGPGAQILARRLVDAGIMHPVPPGIAGAGGAGGVPIVVTVVIPARDRADGIADAVGAIRAAATPAVAARTAAAPVVIAEIIVVDDGSRDRTGAAAEAAGARMIRHDHPRGPAAARITGARAARTELVAFCDSDVRPTSGWLARLVPHFADPSVAAVAPRVASPVEPARRSGQTRAAGLRARYEASRSPLDLGPAPGPVRPGSRISYVPSAALVIRRDLADFEPGMRFGEDVDLVWRLAAAGRSVRYEPTAVVRHQPRESWWGWVRQRFGYGSSAAGLAARHPGVLRPARGTGLTLMSALAVASRRDRPALALAGAGLVVSTAATTVRLARRLDALPDPNRVALALTLRGRRHVLEAAADLARRGWFPLLLPASRPGRTVLAVSFVAPAVRDWWTLRPDVGLLAYLALRSADDVAYCAGVWWGCLRSGVVEPLVPAPRRPFPARRPRGVAVT